MQYLDGSENSHANDDAGPLTPVEKVVANMYDLAMSWEKRGESKFAELTYRLVMEVKVTNPAFNSAEYAFSCNNLAHLLGRQKKYVEAETLYIKAVSAALDIFGLEHPEFERIVRNYSALLKEIEFSDDADPMEQSEQEILAHHFGILIGGAIDQAEGDPAAREARRFQARSRRIRQSCMNAS